MIKLEDLTAHQKFVLRLIGNCPDEKHINLNLTAANYLASLGLANYEGSCRFGLTPAGKELYEESEASFLSHPEEKAVKESELINM